MNQGNPPTQAVCPQCWQTVGVDTESLTYEAHPRQKATCPMSHQVIRPLFSLGQVVATPGALAALDHAGQPPQALLERHLYGDWGQIPPEDARENMRSVRQDLRLLSAYPLSTGETIWVITEWDRSVTTLLLPEEY